MALLALRNVVKQFGGLRAVNGFNLEIDRGEIVGLIGPNGAGKTTIFNVITGVYPLDGGEVRFKDKCINGITPYDTCALGVGRTFQVAKPFAAKSVLYNVMVGAFARTNDIRAAENKALEVLDFLGLSHKKNQLGKSLTIADRKRLEIAKALATDPELLLLDEVMAGLNPKETEAAIGLMRALSTRGITLLIIEHVMEVIMSLSHRVVVLHHGEKIAEGDPKAIVQDASVIKAYLGDGYVAS